MWVRLGWLQHVFTHCYNLSGNSGHCWAIHHTAITFPTGSAAAKAVTWWLQHHSFQGAKARLHFGLSKSWISPKVPVGALSVRGREYNICKLWKYLPLLLFHFSPPSYQITSKQLHRYLNTISLSYIYKYYLQVLLLIFPCLFFLFLLSIIIYFWVFITHLYTYGVIFLMQDPSCTPLHIGHIFVHFGVYLSPHVGRHLSETNSDKNTTYQG